MFVSCTVFVLSGGVLCDRPIPRLEESYRLWYVFECDQVKIKTLYTYCEQLGTRGKDYETKTEAYYSAAYLSLAKYNISFVTPARADQLTVTL
jgi:hypothetical protein